MKDVQLLQHMKFAKIWNLNCYNLLVAKFLICTCLTSNLHPTGKALYETTLLGFPFVAGQQIRQGYIQRDPCLLGIKVDAYVWYFWGISLAKRALFGLVIWWPLVSQDVDCLGHTTGAASWVFVWRQKEIWPERNPHFSLGSKGLYIFQRSMLSRQCRFIATSETAAWSPFKR